MGSAPRGAWQQAVGAAGAARPGARGMGRPPPQNPWVLVPGPLTPGACTPLTAGLVGLFLPGAPQEHSKYQADPTWTPTMEKSCSSSLKNQAAWKTTFPEEFKENRVIKHDVL